MRKTPKAIETDVASYLLHVRSGLSIRAVARREGLHPSTILRRVRRVEDRRDDPAFDAYLTDLEHKVHP